MNLRGGDQISTGTSVSSLDDTSQEAVNNAVTGDQRGNADRHNAGLPPLKEEASTEDGKGTEVEHRLSQHTASLPREPPGHYDGDAIHYSPDKKMPPAPSHRLISLEGRHRVQQDGDRQSQNNGGVHCR